MGRRLATVLAATGCSVLLFGVVDHRGAAAQPRRPVAVVAVGVGDTAPAWEAARDVATALAHRGRAVLPGDEALARLGVATVTPYRPPPEELVARIAAGARHGLELAAFGRHRSMLRLANELLGAADDHLAGVGRDNQIATQLGDLCLFALRARLQSRRVRDLRPAAEQCLRLVPDLSPNPNLHPPEVRRLLDEARRGLEHGRAGRLRVQARPHDPPQCAIRVNGRRVGQTPVAELPLPDGPVAVQVECDPNHPGPIHGIEIRRGQTVELNLQAAVESVLDPLRGLALTYPDAGQQRARLLIDARTIGEAVDADLMLVWRGGDAGIVLVYLTAGQTEPRRADTDNEALGATLGQLLSGRQASIARGQRGDGPEEAVARRSATASAMTTSDGNAAPDTGETSREGRGDHGEHDSENDGDDTGGTAAVGWIAGGLGVAGYGVAWGLYGRWLHLDRRLAVAMPADPDYGARLAARDGSTEQVTLTAALAGTFTTVAVPLLLPKSSGVGTLAWLTGAVGIGVATLGTVITAQHGRYDPATQRLEPTLPLGPLVLAHAAPLLAVPLTGLIRTWIGDDASVSLDPRVSTDSTALRLDGFTVGLGGTL